MKRTKTRGLLILIFVIIAVETPMLVTSNNTTIPSVELAIFNLRYGWGHCEIGTGHSDFYSPYAFTLGIANTGIIKLTLEKVNLTIKHYGQECKTVWSTKMISTDGGLPIFLSPRTYWLKNVSCPETSTVAIGIQVLVNNHTIDFGEVIEYSIIKPEHDIWSNWADYHLYSEKKGILEQLDFPIDFLTLIGIILVGYKQSSRKKKKNMGN